MLNVLHLEDLDVGKLLQDLLQKRDEMPQFFMQSPIIIDCSRLEENTTDYDFSALKEGLLSLNFIPVGVRNIPASMNANLAESGWAVLRESRKPTNGVGQQENISSSEEINTTDTETINDLEATEQQENSASTFKSLTVEKPVRSGQQIYAAQSDMTVLAQTSAGSEIMADGSIHVYGALRGRVLAGAMGNESARIYCQSLQAELIAIAGRYQLLDESDTELKGKPAMIKLLGEKLIIEPLSA